MVRSRILISILSVITEQIFLVFFRYHVGNKFFDRMTVHRNTFLVNKTNRCTEFQLYWYYYSICFWQPFCPSSGAFNRISALVHFMQL